MKKIITLITSLSTLICTSCVNANATDNNIYQNNQYVHVRQIAAVDYLRIFKIHIDGHDYLAIRDKMHGGFTMCHSESCNCRK